MINTKRIALNGVCVGLRDSRLVEEGIWDSGLYQIIHVRSKPDRFLGMPFRRGI